MRPFLDGNMMQIISLAVITGIGLLILGNQASRVGGLIEDMNGVVRTMMELVCRFMPLFAFASLLGQFWSGSLIGIFGLWKPFCVFLPVSVLMVVSALLLTVVQTKAPPMLLLKKGLNGFLVAFSTASSMMICVTLDIAMDFFCTGFDILMLEWELLCQANTLHMLDCESLMRNI